MLKFVRPFSFYFVEETTGLSLIIHSMSYTVYSALCSARLIHCFYLSQMLYGVKTGDVFHLAALGPAQPLDEGACQWACPGQSDRAIE
jgi:hypothetical protein